MKKIHIVDAPCGTGKSRSAINMINNSSNEQKFIYVTPFLSEVKRVKEECSEKNFKEPEVFGTKRDGLKYLLRNKRNIVTTHSMFKLFDDEIMYYIRLNNYILIMDEVIDVVEPLAITERDFDILFDGLAEEDENGDVIWKDIDYKGKLEEYKDMCNLGSVHIYSKSKSTLIWTLPTILFDDFKEIYILTYMFEHQFQRCYYDYYGMEYDYIYIKDFQFTDEFQYYSISKYKDLITICDNDKMNAIGSGAGNLSLSWYTKNSNGPLMSELRKDCANFFRNITNTPSKLNMWTTFKEYKNEVKGNGYASGWVPLTSRATNEYGDRSSVAYLINKYMNPVIKNFFIRHGVEIDEDKYALSELVQFIFRSQIRNSKPINLYIPSKRMRKILEDWLNNC